MGRGNRGGQSATQGISAKSGKPIRVYDVTDKFKKAGITTLKAFEDAIRDRKVEYSGTFDAQGNLMSAVTTFNAGSTAIPDNTDTAAILTHNHPYNEPGRVIGATFSGADVNVLTSYNTPEIRAVSNGPAEYNYIMRKNANFDTQNALKMQLQIMRWERTATKEGMKNGTPRIWEYANKRLNTINEKMRQRGYSDKQIAARQGQIEYGVLKRFWKRYASRYGLDYAEIKREYNY